jgi:hypothetical protein
MTACLDCGRPGNKGSRCPRCQAARAAVHDAAYGPDYQRAQKAAIANAGPSCPNCGQPYTASNPPTGGHAVPVREGGSTQDGVVAQCRRCNYGWKRTGL